MLKDLEAPPAAAGASDARHNAVKCDQPVQDLWQEGFATAEAQVSSLCACAGAFRA